MKHFYLILAAGSLLLSGQFAASQDGHSTATVESPRAGDAVLLINELYPEVQCTATKSGAVTIQGKPEIVPRAQALLNSLGSVENLRWSLLTIPAEDPDVGAAANQVKKLRPDMFQHIGTAKNLILIAGSAEDIEVAIRAIRGGVKEKQTFDPLGATDDKSDSSPWTVFFLKHLDVREAASILAQLTTHAKVVPSPSNNSLLVSGTENQVKAVEQLLSVLDEESPHGDQIPVAGLVPEELRSRLREINGLGGQAARQGNKTELLLAVRKQFEARQRLQLAQVKTLRQKLELLEQRIRTHEQFKEQMIAARVQRMLSDPPMAEAEWPVPGVQKPKSKRASGELYKVQPGDTLGLVIPTVLGDPDRDPPIHKDPSGVRPPVMGYPMQVRADGTLALPLVGETKIAGLSLRGVESKLKTDFVKANILRQGDATVLVSLVRSVDAPAAAPLPLAKASGSRPARTRSSTVQAGDTLGLIIEDVLGTPDEKPPIHTDPTGARAPVMGYPIQVRSDGTITLPYLGQHKVAGMSLSDVEESLLAAFVEKDILVKGKATIMASMIREAMSPGVWRDSDIAPSNGAKAAMRSGIRQSFLDNLKSPSDFADKEAKLLVEAGKKHSRPISGFGGSPLRQLEALRKEHKLVLSVIVSDLKLADSRLTQAKEKEAFQGRMASRGYSTVNDTTAARLAVSEAKAEFEQLQRLYEAYRNALSTRQSDEKSGESEADPGTRKKDYRQSGEDGEKSTARNATLLRQIMQGYMPRQRDAIFDRPTAYDDLTLEIKRSGKSSGAYEVKDTNDRLLRRFNDTNGDGKVDVFEYYKDGVKRYVDFDRNYNERMDTFEYYNKDGELSKRLVDTNEDGEPDEGAAVGTRPQSENSQDESPN